MRQAEIARQKVAELDEEEQKIAVAGRMKERAEAERERYDAQQKEEQAKQAVLTVEATQQAEREKDVAVIAEQAEIQKQRLKKEMEVDASAYETTQTSEAERTAAENERAAKELKATGDRAIEMVPVEVDREKVDVERARVEVERQGLEAKDAHERIAIDLQVQLARIAADKEVGVETAKSFGQAMAAAKITLWGDPQAVASMSEAFFNGQRKGLFLDGLSAGTPEEVKEAAPKVAGGFGSGLAAVVENLTGVKVPTEKLTAIENTLRELRNKKGSAE
ncbi:MAG: hypothetical protein GY953_01020 [bacterium]|nr:hypothetical protein [bacterium]